MESRTFLVKVKTHRGEPLNEGSNDLYRNSVQWKKIIWTKTIRNPARRGVSESLLQVDQNWRPNTPDKWNMVVSTWTTEFLTKEGEGLKAVGDWLRHKTISSPNERGSLFPCQTRLQKWDKYTDEKEEVSVSEVTFQYFRYPFLSIL